MGRRQGLFGHGQQQTRLNRQVFTTSRLLDFASEKELVAQTGHKAADWPLVLVKELTDNTLDACEEAGIAPEITVTVDKAGITVVDNGPGIAASTIEGVIDFAVRVSSREAYGGPSRGQQGNALKAIFAMPFVRDGQKGSAEIEARGVRHVITMEVDHVRQEPVILHEREVSKPVKAGTTIRVPWPGLSEAAGQDTEIKDLEEEEENGGENSPRTNHDTKSRFLQIAQDFTWLNPHLTLKIDWSGECTKIEATSPGWTKWRPSEPTSPHWYMPAHLERLIGAYLSLDADTGREQPRTVREFISEFRGLSGSAKQKKVLDATGLSRAPLSALIDGNKFDTAKIKELLTAMRAHSQPVKPVLLGSIGKEHLERRFKALGCEMESFTYRRVMGADDDGMPAVIEAAFAWCPKAGERRLVTGVNWSPAIGNPFRELGRFGMSMDTVLSQARADKADPVILVLHVARPHVEYTDRGKSAAVISTAMSNVLIDVLKSTTKKWTKQRKAEERAISALWNRRYALTRSRTVSIKEAAWDAIPSAYMKASANDTLPANARQIMYAARPVIAQKADRELGGTFDKYFTQTLLPDYIARFRPAWAGNVVFDARGHFVEPYTGEEIGLGTLEVRNYIERIRNHVVGDFVPDVCEARYPTMGPKNCFGAILFLEKEGFGPLLDAVHLEKRFDIAVMSTKGMSVTASRELIEELGAIYKVPILVLHDFDISGFTIFGTLRSSTRRHTYERHFKVIDAGLRLADIDGLERENFPVSSPYQAAQTLRRHGATKQEIQIMVEQGKRVELNALTSDQLVALIERKLVEHGVKKIIPGEKVIAAAYRRMHRQAIIQAEIDRLIDSTDADKIMVPKGLRSRVEEKIQANPRQSWDEAVLAIVAEKS